MPKRQLTYGETAWILCGLRMLEAYLAIGGNARWRQACVEAYALIVDTEGLAPDDPGDIGKLCEALNAVRLELTPQ